MKNSLFQGLHIKTVQKRKPVKIKLLLLITSLTLCMSAVSSDIDTKSDNSENAVKIADDNTIPENQSSSTEANSRTENNMETESVSAPTSDTSAVNVTNESITESNTAESEKSSANKTNNITTDKVSTSKSDKEEIKTDNDLTIKNDVKDACKAISTKLASVSNAECLNINMQLSGMSNQDFPILLKEFPPLGDKKPLGKVLLIGGIHGDEYSSVSVTFKWLNILLKHHSGLFHWKIAPLLNPDGLLRKNSRRTNANQVDLNRNFPSIDQPQAHLDYWKNITKSDPRRYPGSHPLSENETQWLDKIIKSFEPDVIVSVHAPFGLIDFDRQISTENTTKPPVRLGPLHLHLLGTYPGSLGRYGSEVLNIPVITVELKYAGIMPSKNDISKIWTDMVAWLRKYLSNN